ncbi:MAG: T9SS type A sorting domain-containing protein [bacterium]|nr:MAG: T9SS type A sorting domain-containing protein [bacterium]
MRHRKVRTSCLLGLSLLVACILYSPATAEECPEEDPLQHYTGSGTVVCPCFEEGEEAGAVFDAPAEHYPIQILRVGIGWGSQFGGAPQQLEEAIRIYGAGLPNPGTPLYSLLGPQLTDGAINEFDLEAQLGEVIVESGPFTVTIEFLWDNVGDPYAPSVIHDGNGCQPGKNVVYAMPGSWYDACALGVSGDWIFYVIYRQVNCGSTGIEDEQILTAGVPALLKAPSPNPFNTGANIGFVLSKGGQTQISVYDVAGRRVDRLVDRYYKRGFHSVFWNGRSSSGARLPSGVYFIELRVGDFRSVSKALIAH